MYGRAPDRDAIGRSVQTGAVTAMPQDQNAGPLAWSISTATKAPDGAERFQPNKNAFLTGATSPTSVRAPWDFQLMTACDGPRSTGRRLASASSDPPGDDAKSNAPSIHKLRFRRREKFEVFRLCGGLQIAGSGPRCASRKFKGKPPVRCVTGDRG